MKPSRTLAALAIAAALTAGCDTPTADPPDDDCDAEDLANQEDECGYHDSAGVWVLYPWIVPGIGGHPPAGVHPVPPPGARPRTQPKPPPVKPQPVKPARPAGGIRR